MAATGGQDTQDIAAINPVVDIDDTGVINQPQDTPDLNTLRLDQAMGIQTNTTLKCVDPTCDYSTQPCSNYDMAYGLLDMHMNCLHQKQPREEKHSNKILPPEKLELDPAEDTYEEYQFWQLKFSSYLLECGTKEPEEKLHKLMGRLSFTVHQHISDYRVYRL